MVREIRNPGLGNKINGILKMIPPQCGSEMEALVRDIVIKCAVVQSQTKTANSFKHKVSDFEFWADGYVTGTGREVVIVSGTFSCEHHIAYDPNLGLKVERRQLVCVVHDLDTFLAELRKIAVVASVQVS